MKKSCRRQVNYSIELKSTETGDKLYVKCKGYDNSFNSYIDKKHSIVVIDIIVNVVIV